MIVRAAILVTLIVSTLCLTDAVDADNPSYPCKVVLIRNVTDRPALYDDLHVCTWGVLKEFSVSSKLATIVDPAYINFKGSYGQNINLNFNALNDPEVVGSLSKKKTDFETISRLNDSEVQVSGIYREIDNTIVVLSIVHVDLTIWH